MSIKWNALPLLPVLAILIIPGCVENRFTYIPYAETNKTITSSEGALSAFQEYFQEFEPNNAGYFENARAANITYKELDYVVGFISKSKMYGWVLYDDRPNTYAINASGTIMLRLREFRD